MRQPCLVPLVVSLLAAASCGGDGDDGSKDTADGGTVESLLPPPDSQVPDLRADDLPDRRAGETWDWARPEEVVEAETADQRGPEGTSQEIEIKPQECAKESDCELSQIPLQPCQKAICDKHQGKCVPGPKAPGQPCDDADACTDSTVCAVDGVCKGAAVVCDDGNLCTTDVCQPDKGCIFKPNDNVCDDGNACTKNDRCDSGNCLGQESEGCNCEEDADCAAFDDDDLCNGQVKCLFGKCKAPKSSIIYCEQIEGEPCKKNVCVPATGQCQKSLKENGRSCDDGNACTLSDLCLNGTCLGAAPKSCDDGNACTTDSCDPLLGCLNDFAPYPCDDGDPCTINDYCKFGTCIPGASNSCNTSTCFPKSFLMCGGSDAWSTAGEGATDNVKQYSCAPGSFGGPEHTYAFVAPYDGAASVSLTSLPAGLSLLLLESRGTGCDPTNCRSASEGVLNFDMFQGRSYFLVVDGPGAEGQDYSVALDCIPFSEVRCDDGQDEDEDGLIDCLDPDCAGSPACPAPYCMPIWTLSCGAKDFAANYGLGTTNAVVSYASIPENKGCLDNQWEYTGPEIAYRFDAPGSFNVTVKLTGETAQTDLLVLSDEGHGCDPTECVAWGLKKVSFPAKAGKTYYFVIDGYSNANGQFDIEVSCPESVETNCKDGKDNNLNILTDCEDPDCYQAVECVGFCKPAKEVECGYSEAFANFGWGSTMAVSAYPACTQYVYNGPEMAYRFIAPYAAKVEASLELETASTDIMVLEGNVCNPDKCIAQGLGQAVFEALEGAIYSIVVDGWQVAMGSYVFSVQCIPPQETLCADGLDNDQDGKTDCSDEQDCTPSPDCPECEALYPLACGQTDSWSNSGEDSTDKVASYSCNSALYDGPEFAYLIEPESSGTVTLTLTSKDWDLDLFVLADTGHGCNGANCLAWGTNEVSFAAQAGSAYFVVVDGYGKAPAGFGPLFGASDYTLSMTCE